MTQTTRRTTITRQGLDSDDNDSDSCVDEIEDDHPGAPPAGVCGHNEPDVDINESNEHDDTSELVEDDDNDNDYNDAATALERDLDEKYGVCTGESLHRRAQPTAVVSNSLAIQEWMLCGRNSGNCTIATKMSCTRKRAALTYLMFLKQKRNGIFKGRGCADGRKQRAYIAKEDASAPTVEIEYIMLSCVIGINVHILPRTMQFNNGCN